MRKFIIASLALALSPAVSGAAENISATKAGAKEAPACAALVFRPLPAGGTDGEQTAGSYKSRFARLELRATVQNGAAVNYYLVAGGNRITSAPQVPSAASDCAASRKIPRPGPAKDSCTGERFTAVLAHAGAKRMALLYALNGGSWTFCSAGSF
jgi:hypothetical protein